MNRRSALVLLAAAGTTAAAVRRRRPAPRIEVLLEDGSRQPLDPGSPEGERLLAAAGRAMAASA
ncbi:MAG TPA: hypothetical protein VJ838_02485 [Gaiellaceae bacterium]|nr:hypothetical protein [Gaiellaceae bacterium]